MYKRTTIRASLLYFLVAWKRPMLCIWTISRPLKPLCGMQLGVRIYHSHYDFQDSFWVSGMEGWGQGLKAIGSLQFHRIVGGYHDICSNIPTMWRTWFYPEKGQSGRPEGLACIPLEQGKVDLVNFIDLLVLWCSGLINLHRTWKIFPFFVHISIHWCVVVIFSL